MEIKREQRNQDLSWFVDMYEAGKLELTPAYQRKSVWGAKDRKFFLDTILNNYPCPAIYLQKEITEKSVIYNVVDGKQRLQTVIDFFYNRLRIAKDFPDPRLANKRWRDIEADPEIRYRFFNYSFSVEQLQCEGEVQWDEIFNRVNINQKTLKQQELRHARFNGWLITKAENEAGTEFWTQMKVSTRGRARRMADVEFISILMLVMLENDFVGFPQSYLDELYVKYDFQKAELAASYEDDLLAEENGERTGEEEITEEQIETFEENYETVKDLVGKIVAANENLMNLISKKPLTHIYSLWAVLAFNLDRDIDVNHVSNRFCSLLEKCAEFSSNDFNLEAIPQDNETQSAYKYFMKTTGAATEKGPRKDRHEALMSYFGWA